MPEQETPTQIEAFTKAKWMGAIDGIVAGVKKNWVGIAALVALAHGLWNHYAESKDTTKAEQQIENLQVATYGEVLTNEPTGTK